MLWLGVPATQGSVVKGSKDRSIGKVGNHCSRARRHLSKAHTSLLKRGWKDSKSQKSGLFAEKQYFLDLAGPLLIWIHRGYGCLYRTCTKVSHSRRMRRIMKSQLLLTPGLFLVGIVKCKRKVQQLLTFIASYKFYCISYFNISGWRNSRRKKCCLFFKKKISIHSHKKSKFPALSFICGSNL